MNWPTVVWSMVAAACLTLALVHGMVWWWRRDGWANLFFAVTAVATTLFAAGEMGMMHATTPAQFAEAARWVHVPVWFLVVGLVWFVRVYLHAGRPWLAWTVCGVRTLSLIFNFSTGVSLNYREITALRQVPFLGDWVSIPVSMPNPWMLVGHLSLLLLIVYVADATITVWRRGDCRQAVVVGGGILFFVVGATIQTVLVVWNVIPGPVLASLFYTGIVAAMGFELSRDVLRAADLSRELSESEQRMEMAATAADLGIWVWDIPRDEIWTTEKGRELFGFAKTERVNFETFAAKLHPDDREPVRTTVAAALQNGGDYNGEYRVLSEDFPMRWIVARGRVDFGADRRPLRMRGVSIDVTARKQAELELQERRSELTHLSRVAMLGELSGSLGHELNQPLTAILSNAQAAKRFLAQPEIDRGELEEILDEIVDADRHASAVIGGLRSLLKKGETRMESLDPNDLVQDVMKLLRIDLLNREITTEIDLAPALPRIRGDRVQLQQVLLNLVVNASDAMVSEKGLRSLIVSTQKTGNGVRFAVADRGCGITEESLRRIFEPFYTTKPQGLGLGLAMCRSILSTHSGKLTAENRSDGGAIFHFTLPPESEATVA